MESAGACHDRAVIISTGDEIITGQLLDTNSRWIAERLVEAGIMPVEHVSVPDVLPTLVEAIRRACDRASLVVLSGGLGPTEGDMTRQALAETMGEALALDTGAEAAITAMFIRRGRAMTDRQRRQAMRPSGAVCLANPLGTAPGLHGTIKGADVFCLPGPPGELRAMWASGVAPALRPLPGRAVATRLLHIVGIAEADCVDRLGDLTRRDRPMGLPLVGITASGGILTLRIRFEGKGTREQAEWKVDEVESQARKELGEHVFGSGAGVGHELLGRTVIDMLKARGQTVAVVESCTGGMLGEILTTTPGSSAAFIGGYITYANALKEALGVEGKTLGQFGAVSPQVAAQMAQRGRERSGAACCLSITGIAGPDGATEAKPVGTVHVGLATSDAVHTRHFLFSGDREDVRRRACVNALAMLYFALCGRPMTEPRLLWQVGP